LDETKIGESMTLRQSMEAHRSEPVCSSCHVKMDALGIGLENYDAIASGARRTASSRGFDGTLPNGKSFWDAAELRKLFSTRHLSSTAGLTEKMLHTH